MAAKPELTECSVTGDHAESGRESFPVALQGAAALVMGWKSKCRQETADYLLDLFNGTED